MAPGPWGFSWIILLHLPLGEVAAHTHACYETYWLPTAAHGQSLRLNQSVALFRGSCPSTCQTVVRLPSFACGAACVGSLAECVAANPGMSRLENHVCARCEIPGCQECGQGGKVCRRCFSGFLGAGGSDGGWQACVLWNERVIRSLAWLILIFLVLLVLVVICSSSRLPSLNLKVERKGVVVNLKTGGGKHSLTETLLAEAQGGRKRESEQSLWTARNRLAIIQGLNFSMMSSMHHSSIRMENLALSSRVVHTTPSSLHDVANAAQALESSLAKGDLGLVLFFHSQVFLIAVAAVLWLAAEVLLEKPTELFRLLEVEHFGTCTGTGGKAVDDQSLFLQGAAQKQVLACLGLWLLLVLMSLAFYAQQRRCITKYFMENVTQASYAVRLDGLPEGTTSELELKAFLEEELQMKGKIHGVSIAYNLHALSKPDRIREMLEAIIEYDDVKNDWCSRDLATPLPELRSNLERDKEELKGLLLDKKLLCSGSAFVIFKKQHHALKTLKTRCGLAWDIGGGIGENEDNPACRERIVQLSPAWSEPTGIQWHEFGASEEEKRRNILILMPLRMLVLIGIYAAASNHFYYMMIKPYNDAMTEGAEEDIAIMLTSKTMVLLNVAIQSIVMLDVERAAFNLSSRTDMVTFLWNTFLQAVTMGYFIVQEAWREGVNWSLSSTETLTFFQSAKTELQMGRNLVNLMISEILYMYVVGEIANVLLPLVVYRPILRIVFYWRLGSESIRKFLQSLLPLSKSKDVLTCREAEVAQTLMPLMLWMEYTYIVVFPAMAFMTFYLMTDSAAMVFRWLLVFALVFYIWQRYIMLWAYGKTTQDSADSFLAFIRVWGLVLGMLPTASVWWSWRLGQIPDHLLPLMMVLVFSFVSMVYIWSLYGIDFLLELSSHRSASARVSGSRDHDPGYEEIMNRSGYTWWNVNPIYVLKTRHCCDLQSHECHTDVDCWPSRHVQKGFFEPGKEFRHMPFSEWREELEEALEDCDGQVWSPRKRADSRFRTQTAKRIMKALTLVGLRKTNKVLGEEEEEESDKGDKGEEDDEEKLSEPASEGCAVPTAPKLQSIQEGAPASGARQGLPVMGVLPLGREGARVTLAHPYEVGSERGLSMDCQARHTICSAAGLNVSPSPSPRFGVLSPMPTPRTAAPLMHRMAKLEERTAGRVMPGGLKQRIPAMESALGVKARRGTITERVARLEEALLAEGWTKATESLDKATSPRRPGQADPEPLAVQERLDNSLGPLVQDMPVQDMQIHTYEEKLPWSPLLGNCGSCRGADS